jgi:hypothetical protein
MEVVAGAETMNRRQMIAMGRVYLFVVAMNMLYVLVLDTGIQTVTQRRLILTRRVIIYTTQFATTLKAAHHQLNALIGKTENAD